MPYQTLTQKLLRHVRQHEQEIDDKWGPKELTQEGIGDALGRSRAHVATLTRNLEMRGLIMAQMRYVNGLPSRCRLRKVYRTTNKNGVSVSGKFVYVPVLKMAQVQQHLKAMEQLLRTCDVEE